MPNGCPDFAFDGQEVIYHCICQEEICTLYFVLHVPSLSCKILTMSNELRDVWVKYWRGGKYWTWFHGLSKPVPSLGSENFSEFIHLFQDSSPVAFAMMPNHSIWQGHRHLTGPVGKHWEEERDTCFTMWWTTSLLYFTNRNPISWEVFQKG